MNHRTTIAGVLAGLGILAQALTEDGPWTWARAVRVAVAVAIACLGVWARDHHVQLPAARPPSDPPPPSPAP